LLAHGRWFSPGTPSSSTTKTGRHDIAEILLKVALSTINQVINQSLLLVMIHFDCIGRCKANYGYTSHHFISVRVMVFNTNLNNISVLLWLSVVLEKTVVPRENH
jgi:hypothetical protein